jgi:hypothetical protein
VVQYEYHRVNGHVIRVAPFITRDQLNSSKGGYPYSDQYLKEISIFDPAQRDRIDQLNDNQSRKIYSHHASQASHGSYNFKERSLHDEILSRGFSESLFSHRGDKANDLAFKEKEVKQSTIPEWQARDTSKVKSSSARRLVSKPSKKPNDPRIVPVGPNPKEAPSMKDSKGSTHAFNFSLKEFQVLDCINSALGDLPTVEERRYKSQHPFRFHHKKNQLDQRAENYRLNILTRTRSEIPQLAQPIKNPESTITFLFQNQLERTDAGFKGRITIPNNLPKNLGGKEPTGFELPKDKSHREE